jgi:simple sugar transport system permease protein
MGARALLHGAVPAVAAIGVAMLLILLAGGDPGTAAAAAWEGAFASSDALADTLTRATPLLIAGLAVALAFRGGVLNIGGEGQMLAGASAAVFAGRHLEAWPSWTAIPAVLSSAATGGAAAAALCAALRRYRGVPEVLSTILLNFTIAQFVSWLVHGPMQESSAANPQSEPISESAMLPRLMPPASLHAGLLLGLALAAGLWFVLFRTAAGLRLRATGLSPRTAWFGGMDPRNTTFAVLVASGAMAGIAGGVIVSGITGRLFSNISGGAGYVAIAVALLGRLHPAGILLSAVLFGALEAGAGEMQRSAGVSNALAQVVQALCLLGSLAATRSLREAPARELAA